MRYVLGVSVVLGVLCITQANADIRQARFLPAETMDLTAVGTIDWCVYRVTDASKPAFEAADFKKGGEGIGRKIAVRGTIGKVEGTRWTGVGWGWTDGTKAATHQHRQGDDDGTGIRAWLGRGVAMELSFAAAPDGKARQAHVILRSDGKVRIVARQGDLEQAVALADGKRLGVAVVRYDGDRPLTIAISGDDEREQVVRGIAAALSEARDYESGVPRLPTRQELAARQAAELGKIDYLRLATDFADCMLKYGRDRYGRQHTPLFAVLLTRETEPRIGPQPYFDRPSPYKTGSERTPFSKYNYNRCLNYPAGLGDEGPHKVTLFGCDVYEDADLYTMLIDLSRITGAAPYRSEAEKALTWWFTHTLGPADLYPWGEHLGWDFEHECPTYFEGPSRHLYAACYHEIKDTVPFLDHLAALPAAGDDERTPLERYALGVWKAHYWDPDRAIYCRHGDYTGRDDRTGSLAGFPAHQGAHLRLWVKAYLTTGDAGVKRQLGDILTKVLDVQTARAKQHGFIPFTFEPDVKGKKAERSGQSDRLAHHAAELSVITKQDAPALSAKLRDLAKVLLGEQKLADAVRKVGLFRATGDRGYLEGAHDGSTKPAATVADLSKAETPVEHAREILRRLRWYRRYNDAAYLHAAEQQARIAYVRFCDETCPLPKACADGPRRSVDGKPFPDFYFRGAKLMHAFALLGEAMRK
jgi:hypothetical protein